MNVPETPPHSSPAPSPEHPEAHGLGRLAKLVFGLVAAAALVALFWPRGDGRRALPLTASLVDAEGRPASISERLSPATLVHFWGSWCAPCVTEIPLLLAYAREATGPDFGLVLVAVEDEPEAALRFLAGAEFPLLFDHRWEVARGFGTDKVPETHLLVAGQLVDSFIGATDWSDPGIRRRVAAKIGR